MFANKTYKFRIYPSKRIYLIKEKNCKKFAIKKRT